MERDFHLRIELLSDATFGRGDGVAGLVDQEVEHDADGLPIIHGRTIKGLIVDSCAEILFGLNADDESSLGRSAAWLFGSPGSTLKDKGNLHIGTGQIEADVRDYLRDQVSARALTTMDVLDALTAVRRQTAMDEYDVPAHGSLRAQRVVVRGTVFVSSLYFDKAPTDAQLGLLAAAAAGVQRGGSGRTRGRGRLKVSLYPDIAFDHVISTGD